MQTIKTSYAERFPDNQQFSEPVEDLAIADCFQSIAEWNSFQCRLPVEPKADTNRRHAICIAFQSGAIGAVEAMYMLAADDLYGDPHYFISAFAAGIAALARETPPDSPPCHPGSAQGVRVTSHAQGMLEALADARTGRNAA